MNKPHQFLWGRHLACPVNTKDGQDAHPTKQQKSSLTRDGQDAHPTKQQQSSPTYTSGSQSSQAGFTIIESLVALIVAGILLAATAPIIVLATANRVQARRVEMATQAARTYIDAVRRGAIVAPTTQVAELKSAAVPGSASDASIAYCFNIDQPAASPVPPCTFDNPNKQFFVQAFRTTGDIKLGYQLGVRVYRGDAFQDGVALRKNDATAGANVTQKAITGGIGRRIDPLVEMTTDIPPSEKSFENLCTRLEDSDNSNSKCK